MARWLLGIGGACAAVVALLLLVKGEREGEVQGSARIGEVTGAPSPLELLTQPVDAGADSSSSRAALEPEVDEDAAFHGRSNRIVMRVVDAERQPVRGVQVALSRETGRRKWWRSKTDARGLGRFSRRNLTEEDRRIALHVMPPFLPPLRKVFALEDLPPRPIGFRLPPAGAIEVQVLMNRGRAMPNGTSVHLSLVEEGEALEPGRALHRRQSSARCRDGIARFEHVALGRRFELVASHEASQARLAESFAGPGEAGERVTVELVFGADHPVLLLRAIDEEGRALAGIRIHARVLAGERVLWSASLPTGKNGAFFLALDRAAAAGSTIRFEHVSQEGPRRAARLELGPIRSGRTQYGDVVFLPQPRLASGLVLDARGDPVAGAHVTARIEPGEACGVKADELGTFDLCGDLDGNGDRIWLRASRGDARSTDVEVLRGTTDVVLVVHGMGSIRGRLELDPPEKVKGLTLELTHVDGEDSLHEIRHPGRRDFRFGHLLEGIYRLRVVLEGITIAEVGGLAVRAGEELRDPRLAPLDLSGRMVVHHLEIAFTGRRPHGDVRYGAAGSPDQDEWNVGAWSGGNVWLASTHDVIDVELLPKEHQSQRIEDVRGYARVELQRPLPVRLRVSSSAPLVAHPYLLEPSLVQDGRAVSTPTRERFVTESSREALLHACATGRCEVRWRLHRVFAGIDRAAEVELGRQSVEVGPGPGEQVVELELPPGLLLELLEDPPL